MIAGRAVRALLLVGALSAACRSQPSSGATPAPGDSPSTGLMTYNVVTGQEIADANLLGNIASVIVRRLRPAYLIDKTAGAGRSTQPIMVSVNGGQLNGLNALDSIPGATIAEIRYLTVGEASQRFNSRTNGPVILVTLMSR